jgi:hypothetical protein
MSQQLQLRRNTQPTIGSFVGAQGEALIDTTNNRIVVGDGLTAGGWSQAKLNDVARMAILTRGVNLNPSSPGDVAQIPIVLPQGMSIFRVVEIIIGRPSVVSSHVGFGVFTGPSVTGATISASQTLIILSTAQNVSGNAASASMSNTMTTFNASSLFFHVFTVNGSPMTVDVEIVIAPLS